MYVVFCAAFCCSCNLTPHPARSTASTHGTCTANWKMMSNVTIVVENETFSNGFDRLLSLTHLHGVIEKDAWPWIQR